MNPSDQNPSAQPEPVVPIPQPTSPQMGPPLSSPQPVSGQPAIPVAYVDVASTPGKGLGIAGFILAIVGLFTFGFTSFIGLILSIIGRVKSKRAGSPSGLALAGIIISSISMVVGLIVGVLFFTLVINVAMQYSSKCKELGVGAHQNVEIMGSQGTLTCGSDGSADWSSSSDYNYEYKNTTDSPNSSPTSSGNTSSSL